LVIGKEYKFTFLSMNICFSLNLFFFNPPEQSIQSISDWTMFLLRIILELWIWDHIIFMYQFLTFSNQLRKRNSTICKWFEYTFCRQNVYSKLITKKIGLRDVILSYRQHFVLWKSSRALLSHPCNHSCSGGRDKKDCNSQLALANNSPDPM
jgi:hypothetical protein